MHEKLKRTKTFFLAPDLFSCIYRTAKSQQLSKNIITVKAFYDFIF